MDYKEKSYQEMKEWAQSVHPDAKLTLDNDGKWVLVIETDFYEAQVVDPSWENTPAAEAFNEDESSYGSTLHRWAAKNGHYSTPLYIVAATYNLLHAQQVFHADQLDKELKARGLTSWEELVVDAQGRSFTAEERKLYKEADEEADRITAEAFQTRWKEIPHV